MDIKRTEYRHKGQGLVEYLLVLVGLTVVVILALGMTGTTLAEAYCQVVSAVGGPGCDCTSSFDDPSALDEWQGLNKEQYMTVENGKGCVTRRKGTYLNPCSIDLGSSDFVIDLKDVSIEGAGVNQGIDVVFRAQDEKNAYYFTYNANKHFVRFWKIVDGKWISLNKKYVPAEWASQDLDFQIRVEGDVFTAYKDGDPILQAQDDAYQEGQYGIRNKNGPKVCVGEMTVQQLP